MSTFYSLKIPKLIPSDNRYFTIIVSNTEEIYYISGACYITVITGSVFLNGYLAENFKKTKINNPSWVPSLSCKFETVKNKRKLKKEHIKSELNDILNERLIKFIFKNKFKFAILIEEIDYDSEKWLTMAEDYSLYGSLIFSNVYSNNSTSKDTDMIKIKDVEYDLVNKELISVRSAIFATEKFHLDSKLDVIKYSSTWVEGADRVANKFRSGILTKSVITGSKGVGKSTFMKYLTNRILSDNTLYAASNPLCIIDCDIGQPELTPSGIVSLHLINGPFLQPSHLNLISKRTDLVHSHHSIDTKIFSEKKSIKHVKSFFIGDITTKNDPTFVITAIKKLLNTYNEITSEYTKFRKDKGAQQKINLVKSNSFNSLILDDSDPEEDINTPHKRCEQILPLIINTDGFVKYLGAEIINSIINMVKPTDVFHIAQENNNSLPIESMVKKGCNIYRISPARETRSRISAIDLRQLKLLSYFTRDNSRLKDYILKEHKKFLTPTEVALTAIIEADDNEISQSKEKDENKPLDKVVYSNKRDLYIQNAGVNDFGGIISTCFLQQDTFILPFQKFALGLLNEKIDHNLYLAAFNASIVGIHVPRTDNLDKILICKKFKTPSTGSFFSMNFAEKDSIFDADFVGLGIVRSVNLENMYLVIQSPIDLSQVPPTSKLFLYKSSNLPIPITMLYSPNFPVFPYLSNESTGEGSSMSRSRGMIKRKRFQQAS